VINEKAYQQLVEFDKQVYLFSNSLQAYPHVMKPLVIWSGISLGAQLFDSPAIIPVDKIFAAFYEQIRKECSLTNTNPDYFEWTQQRFEVLLSLRRNATPLE